MKSPSAALLLTGLLTLLVVAAPLFFDKSDFALDTSTRTLLAGDERADASYRRMQEMLDGLSLVCVLIEDEHLLSNEGVARIKALGDGLRSLPGVEDVKSLTHSWRPARNTEFTLDPSQFIQLKPMVPLEPTGEAEWERVERFVLDYPLARDLFISRDGQWALVLVTVERDLTTPGAVSVLETEVRVLLKPLQEDVGETHVLGFPFLEEEVRRSVREDARSAVSLAALLAALILIFTFRSAAILGAVMLFLAAGLAAIPMMLRWTGLSLNVYTVMLLPLTAGVQLTVLVHFFTAFQDHLRKGGGTGSAVRSALSLVFRPSCLALVTTSIGLLSLRVSDVGLMREFGLLGASVLILMSVITFVPLALLVWFSRREDDQAQVQVPETILRSTEMTVAESLLRWTGRHRRGIVVGALALVVACVPGVLALRTETRATEFLSPESPGREGLLRLDEHLGGVNVFHLEVDCELPGGAAAPESLEFLEDLRLYAESLPGVTNVYSYAMLLGLVNQLWTGDESGELHLPASPMLSQIFTSGLRALDWALLESFLDEEGRRTSVLVRTREMPGEDYLATLQSLMDFAERECPDGISLNAQRGIHDLVEMNQRIVKSQILSLGVCAVAIALAVALLWRSWRSAVLILLVNVPALGILGGLMGFAQVPLNSVTVMIAAVVLGIAVDDSIHWLAIHRRESRRTENADEVVRRTLVQKLKPMACTTGILVSGLLVLSLSRFPPLANFGLMSSVALLVSWISTALLLPSLVRRNSPPEADGG